MFSLYTRRGHSVPPALSKLTSFNNQLDTFSLDHVSRVYSKNFASIK